MKRSTLLWTARLPLVVVVALLAVGIGATQMPSPQPQSPAEQSPGANNSEAQALDVTAVVQGVLDETNALRRAEQLPELETDESLREAAVSFARYMAETGEYGHTADGRRPSERAAESGYEYCLLLENIAFQLRPGAEERELAAAFVEGWHDSPDHREALLDPDVVEIGIGVARSADNGAYYAVQKFGRPRAAAIRFRIENRGGEPVQYVLSRESRGEAQVDRPTGDVAGAQPEPDEPTPNEDESDQSFDLPPNVVQAHQRCRPTWIAFAWQDEPLAVQDGATYTLRQDAGTGQWELSADEQP